MQLEDGNYKIKVDRALSAHNVLRVNDKTRLDRLYFFQLFDICRIYTVFPQSFIMNMHELGFCS